MQKILAHSYCQIIMLAFVWVFGSSSLLQAQIRVTIQPRNLNALDEGIELCFGLENTSSEMINLEPSALQRIVIQFGSGNAMGDNTAVLNCLTPVDFTILQNTISQSVSALNIDLSDSDREDLDIAFRFEEEMTLLAMQKIELFCLRNSNISGDCSDIVMLIDCQGSQRTTFNDEAIVITSPVDCYAQGLLSCVGLEIDIIADLCISDNREDSLFVSASDNFNIVEVLWNTGSNDHSIAVGDLENYSVEVTDSTGCIATDVISLSEIESFPFMISESKPCMDASDGALCLENLQNDISVIEWSSNNLNIGNQSCVDELNAGIYDIMVIDTNNCIYFDQVELLSTQTLESFAVCAKISEGTFDFSWSTDGVVDSINIVQQENAQILGENQNSIQLTNFIDDSFQMEVILINGCEQDTLIETCYNIDDWNGEGIYIPNVVTPNNDMVNDAFEINGVISVVSLNVGIFDRWGNRVKSKFEPLSGRTDWSFLVEMTELEMGVYTYFLEIDFPSLKNSVLQGSITLLR